MEVEIKDWGNIINIESNVNSGDIYTISLTFLNQEVMTYGYVNKKQWMKDYSYLIEKLNRRL